MSLLLRDVLEMENDDMQLISSSVAVSQHCRCNEDGNNMLETGEQISSPALEARDSGEQKKIPLSEYLLLIGWNFKEGSEQQIEPGFTPGPRNRFPSFDPSYIPVIKAELSPATKSLLLIDIDAAHENWLQSQRQTSPLHNVATCNGITPPPPPHIINVDIEKWFPCQRRMHKVSWQLRVNQEQQSKPSVYDPIMVSLGPYHHGKEQFHQAQEFKTLCLHWCTNGMGHKKSRIYNLVLCKIDKIRSCYAEALIVDKYEDDSLALMMLLDACFIINFMMTRVSDEIARNTYNCLGVAAAIPFAARDIMVLENQIPFFVLELLMSEIYGQEEGKDILEKFLSGLMSLGPERAVIPQKDKYPPIHILEACRRILVEKKASNPRHWLRTETYQDEREQKANLITRMSYAAYASKETSRYVSLTGKANCYHVMCPSITYLKSKGIIFRPSPSHFLDNINFQSHALYGLLQLPVCYVSDLTPVFLSNMIAYETAPDNVIDSPDLEVLSYTNFLKALIQTPADVLELQQKGILRINRYANQEQVVKLFQSINTFNLRNAAIYQDVMIRVGEHCNSKAKTWMADLIHGKLNSPWTIIALFSATILLILTFLQTFFTIHTAR